MSAGYETLYETPYETHNVQQANPSAHKTCMKQGRETRGCVRGYTLARADRSPLRPPLGLSNKPNGHAGDLGGRTVVRVRSEPLRVDATLDSTRIALA